MASKVFYHLGSFKDSLNFALGAGPQFDVNGRSEYIETIICKGISSLVCAHPPLSSLPFVCSLTSFLPSLYVCVCVCVQPSALTGTQS